MSVQTKTPSTVVSVSGTGTVPWSNPSRASTSNNSYATVTLLPQEISYYLKCTGYGFNWATGSVPKSIKVNIERLANIAGRAIDYRVRLIKNNVIQSEEQAQATTYPVSDTVAVHTFDVSGWTASDFNNSNFGVALSCKNSMTGFLSQVIVSVDVISIEIECETTQYITLPKLTGILDLHVPKIRSAGDIYLPKLSLFSTLNPMTFTTFIVIPPKLPFFKLIPPTFKQDQAIKLPKLTLPWNLKKLRFPTTWTPESTPTPTTWSDT